MDLAIVTALSNLGGLGVLSAVLFVLLLRQLNLFDKHMTALVSRLNALEGDVAEIKEAIGEPHRMRVYAPDEPDPAA